MNTNSTYIKHSRIYNARGKRASSVRKRAVDLGYLTVQVSLSCSRQRVNQDKPVQSDPNLH